MEADFQITKGDYGRAYIGSIENVDLTGVYTTCVIYLWDRSRVALINGKSCTITFVTPNTELSYTPDIADFATATPGLYSGAFKMSGAGIVERTMKFTWQVLEKEPT